MYYICRAVFIVAPQSHEVRQGRDGKKLPQHIQRWSLERLSHAGFCSAHGMTAIRRIFAGPSPA